jgi:hypothetical protein
MEILLFSVFSWKKKIGMDSLTAAWRSRMGKRPNLKIDA